jgi:preprotein translocase subunit SecA
MSLFSSLFNTSNSFIKQAQKVVDQVNAFEETVKTLTNEQFKEETEKLKARLVAGETVDDFFAYAAALVREASSRTLGQRHYDVQIIGGYALHKGRIAEMRTGEGKTLVATIPAYVNALTGEGVHIVTVNDYLARRDAAWMGEVFAFLGLSTGVTNSQNTSFVYSPKEEVQENDDLKAYRVVYDFLKPATRKEAYACDITYGTNNEYGFDYLRDNLAQEKSHLVGRGYAYAIVDEIDSILIDEARTPLIISSETAESESLYTQFSQIARLLEKERDYTVDEKLKAIQLTDEGITKAEQELGFENIYTEKGLKYVHHLETAVRAQALYEKDKDYVVAKDEIVIVDPFTGRLQPGRRWSEGLHQAIEAKEGVKIQKETRSVASITFQNFFRMYKKVSGMTGTAETSKEEFFRVYGLDVVKIPTHRPNARRDNADLIFQTEKGKWQAIAKKVKELQDKGQPVLIGTVSIEKNELLSAYLKGEGVRHTILNAKNHEQEGEIIADAGAKAAVTVATNMAGRGVDIKLGGKAATDDEAEVVKSLGGLYVIGTERHEARRIDNQLRGRAGRQGDPGETSFFVSLEDDLMRVFGGDSVKNMIGRLGLPEDEPIQNSIVSRALESAQAKIEGFHFDARKHTLEYDDVMNHQRQSVYARRRAMVDTSRESIKAFLDEVVPFHDDLPQLIIERIELVGEENFYESVRKIILYVNDMLWVEQLENNIISPKILGSSVEINPLIVIIAVLVGAKVAGVIGALLAVPVAALLAEVAKEVWARRPSSGG